MVETAELFVRETELGEGVVFEGVGLLRAGFKELEGAPFEDR